MSRRTSLVSLSDRELTARFQHGDRASLEVLIDRYRRFARSKSRGYFLMGGDAADVEQEALIGLFKAVRDFDCQQDTPFRAFAELCITRQIISAIKAATRHKHHALNLAVPLTGAAGEGTEERGLEAVLADQRELDPAGAVIDAESLAGLRHLVESRLSPLELEVLDLFAAGHSYREIAELLARHTKAIDNALQRIKFKLEPAVAAA